MSSEYKYVPLYGRRRGSRRQDVVIGRLITPNCCIFDSHALSCEGLLFLCCCVYLYRRGLRVVGSKEIGQCEGLKLWNDDSRTPRFLFLYLLYIYTTRPTQSPQGNKTFAYGVDYSLQTSQRGVRIGILSVSYIPVLVM